MEDENKEMQCLGAVSQRSFFRRRSFGGFLPLPHVFAHALESLNICVVALVVGWQDLSAYLDACGTCRADERAANAPKRHADQRPVHALALRDVINLFKGDVSDTLVAWGFTAHRAPRSSEQKPNVAGGANAEFVGSVCEGDDGDLKRHLGANLRRACVELFAKLHHVDAEGTQSLSDGGRRLRSRRWHDQPESANHRHGEDSRVKEQCGSTAGRGVPRRGERRKGQRTVRKKE